MPRARASTDPARRSRRVLTDEGGSASLEFITVGLILLVPLVYLIVALGTIQSQALGVETARTRLVLIAASTLMTSAAVSISGIIGWIGLLIPHIARALVGPDFSKLLPASLILGGCYLTLMDTLARSASVEIPLGILTAAVGAPFFLWLLLMTSRRGWN